jgi:uracil-DNA glycosylase
MTQEINIQEISQKLYDKVKDKGWNKLRTFLLSSDMDDIFEKLVKEVEQGKRFTPPVKSLFTALEKCPLDSVKVVIIGQDPYPQLGVADGIAFSCSNTGKIEKSLQYMHNSIVETVDAGYVGSPDLSNWAEQGVLMLNSALTTTIGKPGTHLELWQPFMAYLLDILAHYKNDLVYVFLGKKAQEFAYQNFPDEWYLNIDSDICLEKNFDEEMEKIYDSLKEDHIYGSENRFHYSSLNDYRNKENFSPYPCGKMIQGFFQLYKQKILYDDSYDCSWCDVKFSNDFHKKNFLDNVICNHLGNSCVNWQGRKDKTDFIQ